jgi:hypothetical protein
MRVRAVGKGDENPFGAGQDNALTNERGEKKKHIPIVDLFHIIILWGEKGYCISNDYFLKSMVLSAQKCH